MPILSVELYEYCLLSNETIRLSSDPEIIIDWAPSIDNKLHPALCPICTAKSPEAYTTIKGHPE